MEEIKKKESEVIGKSTTKTNSTSNTKNNRAKRKIKIKIYDEDELTGSDIAQNLNIPLQGTTNASSDSNGSSRVLSFLE